MPDLTEPVWANPEDFAQAAPMAEEDMGEPAALLSDEWFPGEAEQRIMDQYPEPEHLMTFYHDPTGFVTG